jgi:hypothetical protein
MIGQLGGFVSSAWQSRIVQAISATLMLPIASTTMQKVGLSSALDPGEVSRGLTDGGLWLCLAAAVAFGGLGGIVAELLSLRGHVELPHRVRPRKGTARRTRLADPRHEIDLGIVSRVMLGATAALALLALDAPGNASALLVNSLIAGSAATGVFRLVQGRMLGKKDASAAPAADKATRSAAPTLSVVVRAPAAAAQ